MKHLVYVTALIREVHQSVTCGIKNN